VQDQQPDTDAEYWTLDMAAKHFSITTATVRRYIREGLPAYYAVTGKGRPTTCVNPIEYTLWKMEKEQHLRNTQTTTSP
jgi:LDH2 family malate/lactate/ureidoglycolate dehydrogenase